MPIPMPMEVSNPFRAGDHQRVVYFMFFLKREAEMAKQEQRLYEDCNPFLELSSEADPRLNMIAVTRLREYIWWRDRMLRKKRRDTFYAPCLDAIAAERERRGSPPRPSSRPHSIRNGA